MGEHNLSDGVLDELVTIQGIDKGQMHAIADRLWLLAGGLEDVRSVPPASNKAVSRSASNSQVVVPQPASARAGGAANHGSNVQLQSTKLSYPRSQLKRAIAHGLTLNSDATTLSLCDWLDEEGYDLPANWRGSDDRSFRSAYLDPKLKHNLESAINKVRTNMRSRGLL
jgi:hypothetical protein